MHFLFDFFIPLSTKTYTFESISGKLLWEALVELREALGELWEGLEELQEALYIDKLPEGIYSCFAGVVCVYACLSMLFPVLLKSYLPVASPPVLTLDRRKLNLPLVQCSQNSELNSEI